MELEESVRERRSIRHFLDRPVSEAMIADLIAKSLWVPSWGNTQPWEIIVVTGEKLEAFKQKNRQALLSGKASNPDIPMPQTWPERHMTRYKQLGKEVLASLGIAREDKAARVEHFARMFALFDAPALVLVAVDKELSLEYAMLDVGIFLQTFCLLAHARGLGTCILAASVNYPEIVRALFDVPENKRLVMGAALGWPDGSARVNGFARSRGSLAELVRWVS